LLAAGQSPLRDLKNSVSPPPQTDAGCLFNLKKTSAQDADYEWKVNTEGTGDWRSNNPSFMLKTSANAKV